MRNAETVLGIIGHWRAGYSERRQSGSGRGGRKSARNGNSPAAYSTELGADLSAFKTSHHFASWLCLCPDNATSASKVLRRQTRRSQQRVRQALRMAAASLHHDKSYLGDKYRRLRARLGAPKALTAMAHQLARIIWHLLTYRVPFDLSLFAAQEQANQRRQLKRLMAAARHLGYQLTPVAS